MTRARFRFSLRIIFVGATLFALKLQAMECGAAPGNAYSIATAAIDHWEAAHTIELASTVRNQILAEFCAAATTIGSDGKDVTQNIERAVPATIEDYLNRAVRTDLKPRTLEATLREKLGFGGLSRPIANRYARLSIRYLHPVDYLTINGERHSPSPEFLVSDGSTALVGFANSRAVCQARVTVVAPTAIFVECR